MDKTQINIFNFSTNDAEVAALMLKFSEKKMKDGKAVVNFTNMEEIKELVERKIKGPATRKRTSDKAKTPTAKRSKGVVEEVVEIGVSKSPKPGSSKTITKKPVAEASVKVGETQIQIPVTQFVPIRPRPSNIQIPPTQNDINRQQQFIQPRTTNMQATSTAMQIPHLHHNQWQQTPATIQTYSTPQNYYTAAYPASYFQGQGMSNFASASEGEEASSDDEEEERIPFQDLTNFAYDD